MINRYCSTGAAHSGADEVLYLHHSGEIDGVLPAGKYVGAVKDSSSSQTLMQIYLRAASASRDTICAIESR